MRGLSSGMRESLCIGERDAWEFSESRQSTQLCAMHSATRIPQQTRGRISELIRPPFATVRTRP